MYLLIQSNVHKNPDFDLIYPVLDELAIAYEKIALTSDITELTIQPNRNDVFVYGSVKLAMLAQKNSHWYPGSFYGGNHLFEVNSRYYQDHLLNYTTHVAAFADDLNWQPGEEKFIKPFNVAKIFTGKVFSKEKWQIFVENHLTHSSHPLLNAHTQIQVSQPRDIIKEARLWIVAGQIVEAVYYRILKPIEFESQVTEDGIEFAKQMINIFNVAEAFVMDICLTDIGWKIVEVNCINSAGFFPNTDIKKIFKALNNHF